jgi:hypothetical protein
MKLERYNAFKHYEMISGWWKSWGQDPVSTGMLPNTGVVVEDMACAFLYRTDSDVCLIENLVTKKVESEEEKQTRDEAIDWAVQALCSIASESGYKAICAFTAIPQVVERGKKLGFESKPKPLTFLSRRL